MSRIAYHVRDTSWITKGGAKDALSLAFAKTSKQTTLYSRCIKHPDIKMFSTRDANKSFLSRNEKSIPMLISAISLAVSLFSLYYTRSSAKLLEEGINISLGATPRDQIRLTDSGLLVRRTFIFSNTANIDISIKEMRCENLQINHQSGYSISRPCNFVAGATEAPLHLKAGASQTMEAEITIEPASKAADILASVRARKIDPSRAGWEFLYALARQGIDIYDVPLFGGPSNTGGGIGIGSSERVDSSNGRRFSPQGFVIRLSTGRGMEVRSPSFHVYTTDGSGG